LPDRDGHSRCQTSERGYIDYFLHFNTSSIVNILLEYTTSMSNEHKMKTILNKHTAFAFTLAEVLVSIGILAILISLSLPMIGSIRERTRSTLCTVHIRNSSQAIQIYSIDYRGHVPFGGTTRRLITNPAGETIAVGGRYGLYVGHWTDLMPEYWNGELWEESMMCPAQPAYDPEAPDWPDAFLSVDGFRRQPWFDLSAAFHLSPESMSRGSRLHNANTNPQALHKVTFPSAKSLLYERVGFCLPRNPDSLFWIDAAQTQRYATSVAIVDGSVFRYAQRNAYEPVYGVGLEYTMDGILGRDIDHSLIGEDAHHRLGFPNSWADTN
jgi:hypothetical protein